MINRLISKIKTTLAQLYILYIDAMRKFGCYQQYYNKRITKNKAMTILTNKYCNKPQI